MDEFDEFEFFNCHEGDTSKIVFGVILLLCIIALIASIIFVP